MKPRHSISFDDAILWIVVNTDLKWLDVSDQQTDPNIKTVSNPPLEIRLFSALYNRPVGEIAKKLRIVTGRSR